MRVEIVGEHVVSCGVPKGVQGQDEWREPWGNELYGPVNGFMAVRACVGAQYDRSIRDAMVLGARGGCSRDKPRGQAPW